MQPIVVIKIAALLSIFLIVVSIGLRARLGSMMGLLSEPASRGLLVRAMLVMFVVFPAFVILLVKWLPLETTTRTALLALAISPMPPIIPLKQRKLGGETDFITALQVLATLTSMALAPLYVALLEQIFHRDAVFNIGSMVTTLILSVGAPLFIGMLLGHYARDLADRLVRPLSLAGMALLALVAVVILASSYRPMIEAAHDFAVLAAAIMVAFGLLAGHMLGKGTSGDKSALAIATASRHPGVAIGLAVATFPQQATAVLAAVLLYLLVNFLLTTVYKRWVSVAA
jgi:BASS family bile acid:Na+ symporter